ncbi:adenylate/guanylate cyclase domain-containing protein [Rhodococcus erythropolis]|uniref:adenylate/guanylate cyclase domain-containing protein n=1 Tax=Rhodococcus erythropolis TaxID=1833 RepID=UPI0037F1BADD
MGTVSARFADKVIANYGGATPSSYMQKNHSLVASARHIEPGHPMFVDLQIGESRMCEIASVFLDLTNFTGRTFWDSPDEVTRLAHAVLSGFTDVVKAFGGHVLGLRGDGLFAGFGPGVPREVSVSAALLACGVALNAVQEQLNPRLERIGVSPVQARAGADFGSATFVRSGTLAASEVNVIGFASNFAAKCEKSAKSWEVVIGQEMAASVPNQSLLTHHESSPKTYTRLGESRSYKFYDYKYSPLLEYADSFASELAGRSLDLAIG